MRFVSITVLAAILVSVSLSCDIGGGPDAGGYFGTPGNPVVAAGSNHTLVIDRSKRLWAFGMNHNGQLGIDVTLPDTTRHDVPVSVADNVIAVWASGDSSAFLTEDGRYFVMGYGPWVRPETGTYKVGQAAPLEMEFVLDDGSKPRIVSASLGGNGQILVIDDQARLWALGLNSFGELGIGGIDGSPYGPTIWEPMLSATSVKMVSQSFYHSVILKADGTVWTAGRNDTTGTPENQYRLGTGTAGDKYSWTQIATDGTYIDAGTEQSLIIKNDDSLWMFGSNVFGQSQVNSDSSADSLSVPAKIAGGVKAASTQNRFTAAIFEDGTLRIWGDRPATISKSEHGSSLLTLALGDFHAVFVGEDGSFFGHGESASGELLDLQSPSRFGKTTWIVP